MTKRTALITGGAARIGAAIARELHAHDIDIVIHYRNSVDPAAALVEELNAIRHNSADTVQGDLLDHETIPRIIDEVAVFNNDLSILVNNASSFYATPLGTVTGQEWDDLVGTNMKAPFFLAQAAAPWLRKSKGCIVNLVDVHGIRPKKDFPVYSMAKAANAMMIMSLARELGPDVRVNGVAPGAILWPEHEISDLDKARILSRVPLARHGEIEDIARTVRFLVTEADYITGQLISVDGGRTAQQ
ncbi:MAG: pteridine reductase [Gammaproteobacteria bacterium]|jgi:pteridine reductase